MNGQHLLNLDIGLPIQRLRPVLKACINGESSFEQIVLDAVNRRGKKIVCQVTCSPLHGSTPGGIIVMDEIGDGRAPERANP